MRVVLWAGELVDDLVAIRRGGAADGGGGVSKATVITPTGGWNQGLCRDKGGQESARECADVPKSSAIRSGPDGKSRLFIAVERGKRRESGR